MSKRYTDSASVVLTYGLFSCTGERAVEAAYLMSCAEAAIDRAKAAGPLFAALPKDPAP